MSAPKIKNYRFFTTTTITHLLARKSKMLDLTELE